MTADPSARNQLLISWHSDAASDKDIEEKEAEKEYPSYAMLVEKGAPSIYFPYAMFPQGREGEEESVLRVACTRIEGGLVMTLTMHHCVVDGTGLGQFVKTWAGVARGEETGSGVDGEEPVRRTSQILGGLGDVIDEGKERGVEAILKLHREYKVVDDRSQLGKRGGADKGAIPAAVSRIFGFARSTIDAVKDSLKDTVSPSFLTVNNILCAIIWSRISHIRTTRPTGAETGSSSRLGFAVNGRRVLGFIEQPYLGNINLLAQVEQPISSLNETSAGKHAALAPIVSAIATATRRINKSHMSDLVHLVEILPDLSSLGPGWDFDNGLDLSITSWADLGLYDADFGDVVGKAGFVRTPHVLMDGTVVILPRQRNQIDERIEVTIMLREDDIERLCKDEVWKSWCVNAEE